MVLNSSQLKEQVKQWLTEDIGVGDLTSMVTIPEKSIGSGIIYTKEEGILAGIPVLEAIFLEADPTIQFSPRLKDGQKISAGDVIAEVFGNVHSLLATERVALNILQRLSGIATKTKRMVVEAQKGNPNVRVADTRKTTPGLRMVEKYAVAVGGGYSHRYGLYDAVLIKDNHIKASGGIQKAVEEARKKIPHTMTIEVEVETIQQVKEAIQAKPDIIMFDNMSLELMEEALKLINGQYITEASGGITIDNIAEVAAIGVDIISIGSLTYSVDALDISIDLSEKKPGR